MDTLELEECRKRCASYRYAIANILDNPGEGGCYDNFTEREYDTTVYPFIEHGYGETLNDEKHLERLLLLVARRVYSGAFDDEIKQQD